MWRRRIQAWRWMCSPVKPGSSFMQGTRCLPVLPDCLANPISAMPVSASKRRGGRIQRIIRISRRTCCGPVRLCGRRRSIGLVGHNFPIHTNPSRIMTTRVGVNITVSKINRRHSKLCFLSKDREIFLNLTRSISARGFRSSMPLSRRLRFNFIPWVRKPKKSNHGLKPE